MPRATVRARRWNRLEDERLVEMGMFAGEKLELLDGVLVVREPQYATHATAMLAAQEALQRAFSLGWHVRPQLPVALGDNSEPEPDLAVVRGSYHSYRNAHPSRPALIVEISDATLARDRRKGGLYARAAVRDYWIVNLIDKVLEMLPPARPLPVALRMDLRGGSGLPPG